jgi:hypothetical protein
MTHMLLYSRLQFALTIAFHYLFPQLTMGLAFFVLYFKIPNTACALDWLGSFLASSWFWRTQGTSIVLFGQSAFSRW